MDVIVSLVNVNVVLSFAVSFMLFDFMQKDMIFQKWYSVISFLPEWMQKPLGMCLKCFHIWVGIFIFLITGDYDLLKFIISIAISYVILVKLFYE